MILLDLEKYLSPDCKLVAKVLSILSVEIK